MKKLVVIIVVISILGISLYFLFSSSNANSKLDKKPIICFGDSITEGNRFTKKSSYPYQLGHLLGESIINEGVGGETSSHALQRIKKDVLDKNPRLVIVQFGGNDPPRQIPYHVTLANNDLMIEKILNSGAEAVILIGEYNMLEPKYIDGFREIAKKRQVLLIDDAIEDIIKDSSLRKDAVHPNARGYKIMAQRIYEALKSIL